MALRRSLAGSLAGFTRGEAAACAVHDPPCPGPWAQRGLPLAPRLFFSALFFFGNSLVAILSFSRLRLPPLALAPVSCSWNKDANREKEIVVWLA